MLGGENSTIFVRFRATALCSFWIRSLREERSGQAAQKLRMVVLLRQSQTNDQWLVVALWSWALQWLRWLWSWLHILCTWLVVHVFHHFSDCQKTIPIVGEQQLLILRILAIDIAGLPRVTIP